MSPADRVKRILDEAVGRDLSSWERHDFLPNVKQLTTLSPKQEKTLSLIEQRLFGEREA